jgi:CRP/FNR family transcriptional regulator, cyclic AMP receptor protein
MNDDLLGWLAALATLGCFASHDMLRLRILALVANAAFVAYGAQAGLLPVLVLHLVLAPVNAWRLWQLLRLSAPTSSPPSRAWQAPPTERRGSS